MLNPRAGQLQQVVTINQDLQPSATLTDLGELVPNYQPVRTRRARIVTLSGRELERARQQVATATHEVTIRYLAGLTPRHQLTWDGRTLEIGHVRVEPENVKRWSILTCTELPSVTDTV